MSFRKKNRLVVDFDGVLCDQRKFDYLSFQGVCTALRLTSVSYQNFVRLRKKGFLARELLQKAFRCRDEELQKAAYIRNKWMRDNLNKYIPKPTKNVGNILRGLDHGYEIVIATKRAKPDIPIKFIERYHLPIKKKDIYCVSRLNKIINEKFNVNDTVYAVKQQMLEVIKKRYQIPRGKCFYVGDTIDDLKAANKVGFVFCGVLSGYVKKYEFASYNVNVFNNFTAFFNQLLSHKI